MKPATPPQKRPRKPRAPVDHPEPKTPPQPPKRRRGGPSGKHATPRLKVPVTDEQRARWEKAAAGVPLAQWLAGLADSAAARRK